MKISIFFVSFTNLAYGQVQDSFMGPGGLLNACSDSKMSGKIMDYGCWCRKPGALTQHWGGLPLDEADAACRDLSKCLRCNKCDEGATYFAEYVVGSCSDIGCEKGNSCCQCMANFAEEMQAWSQMAQNDFEPDFVSVAEEKCYKAPSTGGRAMCPPALQVENIMMKYKKGYVFNLDRSGFMQRSACTEPSKEIIGEDPNARCYCRNTFILNNAQDDCVCPTGQIVDANWECADPPQQNCGKEFSTGSSHKYIDIGLNPEAQGKNEITFEIKNHNDGHLWLEGTGSPHNSFEIVLGGWGGTQSVIRTSKQGTNRVTKQGRATDKNSYTEFTIKWDNSIMRVEREGQLWMQWDIGNEVSITKVSIATGWGSAGEWKMNDLC